MTNGFNDGVVTILKQYGLFTDGVIGTVVSGSEFYEFLKGYDPDVERDIDNPTYDYIVIDGYELSHKTLMKCIDLLNSCGIIIYRDKLTAKYLQKGMRL